MPSVVQIHCPAAQLNLRVDLGNVQINRLSGDPAALWSLPNYPGAPLVNLADPNLQMSPGGGAPLARTSRRTVPPADWRRPGR